MQIGWGLTLLVTITGISIVFLVLVLLVFVIYLYGKSVYSIQNRSKGKPEKEKFMDDDGDGEDDHEQPRVALSVAPPAKETDDTELIAVLAAAVAAYSAQTGTPVRIRSIREDGRPVWAAAGIYQNTRPF